MVTVEAPTDNGVYVSSFRANGTVSTAEERRVKRLKKKTKGEIRNGDSGRVLSTTAVSDDRFLQLVSGNEDELLKFVASVNSLYQQKLKKEAPFMTFIFVGMQSAGKSTIMERFMNSVLNIVQEGTGTRCPLDTTCIHDDSCIEPSCELWGKELGPKQVGKELSVQKVFKVITKHNKKLGDEDRFSTDPIFLVYRSRHVQNMRFVDTPGIISNQSTGRDNRDEIKEILRSEFRKPNVKLCVLLEPKEFATNPIVNFCDDSFGDRSAWIDKATFLMTKFDKQLNDARTASKANGFFKEFHNNKCYPHLVITPTLPKEDLEPNELFEAREKLLRTADSYEKESFDSWLCAQDKFRQEEGDEPLDPATEAKIGFPSAKRVMREIMLADTVRRLPDVLADLRRQLASAETEKRELEEKQKFNDPNQLGVIVLDFLHAAKQKISSYLDGDLEITMKFPEQLQDLEDELDEEESSDWANKELNHYSEKEDSWRDRVSDMEGDYEECVQADKKFLGGKQYQRALQFFHTVLIDALPNPYQLKDKVQNVVGFMSGNLQRENWERALVQVTTVSMRDISRPGINYLVKHVGSIFRRLFTIALDDVKLGEEWSARFKLMPNSVDKYLGKKFDEMLWNLMQSAADKTHNSLEPYFSTVDPSLPTFLATQTIDSPAEAGHYTCKLEGGEYVPVNTTAEEENEEEQGFVESVKQRLIAFASIAKGSGDEAKMVLKKENRSRATRKKVFLPEERTWMITSEETDKILLLSFQYIVALMEFVMVALRFQVNHYLFLGFKEAVNRFVNSIAIEGAWDSLVRPDPSLVNRLEELSENIAGLEDSLQEVQRMQRRL